MHKITISVIKRIKEWKNCKDIGWPVYSVSSCCDAISEEVYFQSMTCGVRRPLMTYGERAFQHLPDLFLAFNEHTFF